MQGKWLTILEYAHQTGKSISTLRRYIKSGKVESKLDDGKYLIFAKDSVADTDSDFDMERFNKIELELKKKEEEICELKMLVNLYENKINKKEEPPELPFN